MISVPPLGVFLRAVGDIARAASVPIVLVTFDYSRKIVRLGPSFPATADYESDLAAIQSHITAAMAKHPGRYGQGRGLK